MGSVLHVHSVWVTPSLVTEGPIGKGLKESVLLNIRKLFRKQPLERSEEKFCYKIKSCPTPQLGSVLHVHVQWVTPSPIPGGPIGKRLEGSVLLNIRKLFRKQLLERSEQKFCYKIKSCPTPQLGSVQHVHVQWVTPIPVPGGPIGKRLEGSVLLNIRKLFRKQLLERSEQKFCYKIKSCPTPQLGSVQHVHVQWVTPIPVPGAL